MQLFVKLIKGLDWIWQHCVSNKNDWKCIEEVVTKLHKQKNDLVFPPPGTLTQLKLTDSGPDVHVPVVESRNPVRRYRLPCCFMGSRRMYGLNILLPLLQSGVLPASAVVWMAIIFEFVAKYLNQLLG